jgi:hypothetical protein
MKPPVSITGSGDNAEARRVSSIGQLMATGKDHSENEGA